jgi:hypothetical protein
MKMVKSLLLGSAAGLVAITAGQAADLPVKAKPVEYVKICSLYGAGFYYMPGTDMCIKVGGWVRVEATWGNDNGSMTWGPYSGQENTRNTSNFVTRERGYITADAREQTAYGTARAYIDVGLSDSALGESNGGQGTFSSNRAFLQWAGITAGLTQSFYDFYSGPASTYRAAYFPQEDTGDGGQWVAAYTAQLGNGVTATLAAENRRDTQIIGVNGPSIAGPFVAVSGGGAGPTASAGTAALLGAGAIINGATFGGGINSQLGYGGYQVPDVVANLRIDQTWGSAQLMGALHQDNAQYYDSLVTSGNGTGHPGDAWGFVVGAGLRLNFPMIAQGDYFQSEVNYTHGALRYLNQPTQGNYEAEQSNSIAYGIMSDCVYGSAAGAPAAVATTGGTSCNLTTAWSLNASYEHYWTPSVHQSFVGAYEAVKYNTQANAILCDAEGTTANGPFSGNNVNGTFAGGVFTAAPGCNNNWSTWGASSRLQWDITKTLYIGVEVLYDRLNSASSANGFAPGGAATGFFPAAFPAPGPGGNPSGMNNNSVRVGGSNVENAYAITWRMHKDFLP